MSAEDNPESYAQEQIERRQKILKETFGLALCTRQKEGDDSTLENQVEIAEEMNVPNIQFDFRNRTKGEIETATEQLLRYRNSHPDVMISIHGETPRIDDQNLEFRNKKQVVAELNILRKIAAISYTVHPPSINSKTFRELSGDISKQLIEKYCSLFTQTIEEAASKGEAFSLAIENMPNRGDEGSWGQSLEEIILLIKEVEGRLIRGGMEAGTAQAYVGSTLDVNHALHNIPVQEYRTVLEDWFKGLGDYLKVIHLYCPSQAGEEFLEKYKLTIEFASRYNPNASIFMESKQNVEITKNAYDVARKVE